MEAKEEIKQFWNLINNVRIAIINLKKYKGNAHYKKQYDNSLKEINRMCKFLKVKIDKIDKTSLKSKFKIVEETVNNLISDISYNEKIEIIKKLELFWPELEIEFENLKLEVSSFEIPKEIPITDSRIDLEEAIKDYDNGCFLSAIVLCRRAYEGALVEIYKIKTDKEPIEEFKCKKCGYIIKKDSYMGIAKLHKWAIESEFINEKFRSIGFLLTDIGSGGAHPLKNFPRDPEIAKVSITTTIALLKEIYKK